MLKRGDHSKQLYLNCYCDSYRKISGLRKNASSQSKYSEDFMNGAFLKDITVVLSLSLSLSVIFSRYIYFFLSRSLTHTIFLHLSQIFKANINAALFALAMKIKGGTEDCFPVFLFLFLISFFTLSHKNESYRHQASVACMR